MCLDKKYLDYFNVAVCNQVISSIIHTNTEYVNFNSDNDFVPAEVW